ncbi:MAG: glycosyltransferase, partial [Marivirga sp.]|nr:glycosyltransferase [Marivirga sp.]
MLKENVFTFPVSIGSYQQFIDQIFYISEHRTSSYVCFANVHMVIEGYNDPAFNSVVEKADIVAPDGSPVALFLRYFRKINQVRVAGLDVFPDLLKEAEARKKAVYFYGTTDDILAKIEEKAKRQYPDLNICGLYSPPFRVLSDEEKDGVIKQINDAKPDLIFVALGCPKQENWMAHHKGKINGCMLGLGHAFKVYAEISKRSPKWMQKMSLEWAYRLYQEPGRLWKRYFYTNSLFLILMLKYGVLRRSSPAHIQKPSTIYKCE